MGRPVEVRGRFGQEHWSLLADPTRQGRPGFELFEAIGHHRRQDHQPAQSRLRARIRVQLRRDRSQRRTPGPLTDVAGVAQASAPRVMGKKRRAPFLEATTAADVTMCAKNAHIDAGTDAHAESPRGALVSRAAHD